MLSPDKKRIDPKGVQDNNRTAWEQPDGLV